MDSEKKKGGREQTKSGTRLRSSQEGAVKVKNLRLKRVDFTLGASSTEEKSLSPPPQFEREGKKSREPKKTATGG